MRLTKGISQFCLSRLDNDDEHGGREERERKYGLKEEKQRRNGKRGGSDDSV